LIEKLFTGTKDSYISYR